MSIRQFGGEHYQSDGEQHWDLMWRLFREAWFVGNVTKYVLRYRKPTGQGLKDLYKARCYLDKLIELEESTSENAVASPSTTPMVDQNGVPY